MSWTVSSSFSKSPDVATDTTKAANVDQATADGRKRAGNGDTNIKITARDGSSYTRR